MTRTDRHVNFHGSMGGGSAANFSVRWTGYYTPQSTGAHQFYVSTRGGYRLYIDNRSVLDYWQQQESDTVHTYHETLQAGGAYKKNLEDFGKRQEANYRLGVNKSLAPPHPAAQSPAPQPHTSLFFFCYAPPPQYRRH